MARAICQQCGREVDLDNDKFTFKDFTRGNSLDNVIYRSCFIKNITIPIDCCYGTARWVSSSGTTTEMPITFYTSDGLFETV